MILKSSVILVILLIVPAFIYAQGGKAEPKRIEFPSGKSSSWCLPAVYLTAPKWSMFLRREKART
ncbi:MAG: hypothetical protein WKF92_09545 [Pyrinomonadaceae bacterium]